MRAMRIKVFAADAPRPPLRACGQCRRGYIGGHAPARATFQNSEKMTTKTDEPLKRASMKNCKGCNHCNYCNYHNPCPAPP